MRVFHRLSNALLELIARALPWASVITYQRACDFAERARRTQSSRAVRSLTEQSCHVELFRLDFSRLIRTCGKATCLCPLRTIAQLFGVAVMSEHSRRSIKEYYDEFPEDDRLKSARGQLEFERTKRIVQRFLPVPPATVADIGGGTGPYFILAILSWVRNPPDRAIHSAPRNL